MSATNYIDSTERFIEQRNGELTVSSEVIAERTDTQHASVLRVIRDNQADFESFGQVGFEIRPGYNNAQVTIAHLNEPQATLLITFMRNGVIVKAFKVELVKQFYAMREALREQAAPQGADLLALGLLEAKRQIDAKDAAITELCAARAKDAPAVEYVETYVTDDDLMLLRDVAKNLGCSETMIRADLLERGWIYAQRATRWSAKAQRKVLSTRYSAYAHKARYFRHVPNHEAPRFRDETMHTLKVTPRGAAALARLYKHGSDDFLDGIDVTEAAAS